MLVVLLVLGTSNPWHADDTADPASSILHHDASAHGFDTGSAGAPEHCAVCHWLQSLRTVWVVTQSLSADRPEVSFAAPSLPTRTIGIALLHLPARAPPA